MTFLSSSALRPLRNPGAILLLALGLGGLGCTEKKPSRTVPGPTLEVGVPVRREIEGSETHSYRLPLDGDTYVRLRIDQPWMDVKAKLIDPEGKKIGFFDDPQHLDEPDRLVWIAEMDGDYQLVVQSPDRKGTRGAYRLKLEEERSTTRKDAERLAAAKAYQEARLLLVDQKEEARKRSLDQQRKALDHWQAAGDVRGQVDSLVQIAEIQNALGASKEALASAEKARGLAEKVHYAEGDARAWSSIGDAYSRLGPFEKALSSYDQALSRWRSLGDPNWQGTVLYAMGYACTGGGRKEEALRYLEQAKPLLQEVGNLERESDLITLQVPILQNRGEYSKALELVESSLKLKNLAGPTATRAAALIALGAIHRQRGELEEALRNFNEALEIDLLLGDTSSEAFARQSLGSVYFNLGDTDRALKEYARAADLYEQPARKGRILVNTGLVYHKGKKEPGVALRFYEQALKLFAADPSPTAEAMAFNNLGMAYTVLGRANEGLPYLKKALKLREENGERAGQANTLLEIGTTYQALGNARRSQDYYQKAFQLASDLGNTDLQAESLYRWALLDRREGNLQAALKRIQDSLEIVESVRGQVVSDKLRTSFLASKRPYYELLVSLLVDLESKNPGRFKAEALEASERARARSLLDLLAEGNVRAGVSPELQKRDIELRSRLSWLQSELAKGASPELDTEMDRVQDAMEQLEVEIRRSNQHYAEVRYPKPLRADQIRNLIDDRAALLQYFTGEDASFLFVVTREGLAVHRLPASPMLAAKADQLRRLIQTRGRRSLPAYGRSAADLYNLLVGPAASVLTGKSRLLIVPDGPLYFLPFEALLTGPEGSSYGDLPYLLKRYSISYVPSASVLADLRKERPAAPAERRFLAFADPDYGGGETGVTRSAGPGKALRQLPESGREVERIAGLFPRRDAAIYLGDDATEQNVKNNPHLATASNVHFALHGTVNADRPELSGLELTRVSPEDGRLQVFEIFDLKLKADLLTLSACQTALGKEVRGEGMVGLTRAFLYAGARSLVVSLWPVPDRSTSDFMYDMYRNLGSGKAEALRRAKLAMISSQRFAEPYYWAPFILSGDPG